MTLALCLWLAVLFSVCSRVGWRIKIRRNAAKALRVRASLAAKAQEAAALAALTPEDVAGLEALGWKPPAAVGPRKEWGAAPGGYTTWFACLSPEEQTAHLQARRAGILTGSTMHAGGLVISSEGVHRAPAIRVGDRVVINVAYYHTDRHHDGKTGVVQALCSNPRAYNVRLADGWVVRTMNVSPAPEHAPGTEVMTRIGPVTLGVRAATPEELRFDPYADGTLKRPMSLVSRDGAV